MKLGSRGLDAGYPGSDLILRGFDLEVEAGEVVALVGPNGSGKSTLLRALARILKPRGGAVFLDGKAISDWSTRDVARRLTLLPQGPNLANDLTVQELVWMGRSPHQGLLGLPVAADREAVEWAIAESGIQPLAERRVSSLSGGERQRAWLAMALAQQPQVLLLDEPTTFLDLNHQLEVLDLVRYLNREHGLTVIMVLHDLNQAARYAGRVCVLSDGRLYRDGPPSKVLTVATLADVFKIDASILPSPGGEGMIIVPTARR